MARTPDTIIRFRIDGRAVIYNTVPAVLHQNIINILKLHANLDYAQRQIPQEGVINSRYPGVKAEVVTIPVFDKAEDATIKICREHDKPPLLAEENAMTRLINKILCDAYVQGATHVHIEAG